MPLSNNLPLEKWCHKIFPLVREVGVFIEQNKGVSEDQIESKDLNSLVSYVDKEAEKMLVSGLTEIVPEAGFITEEGNSRDENSSLVWIVDPLDGTTNFLHQLPFFSISIALYEGEKPLIGVVYEVTRQELFYAWNGGGAFLNGRKISVSDRKLSDGLVATGLPYTTFTYEEEYHQTLRKLTHASRGIRRFGSAALDLAYVACGRFDLYFEYQLQRYDIAAGAILVLEAGGLVTDTKGDSTGWVDAWSIVAGNQRSHLAFFKEKDNPV